MVAFSTSIAIHAECMTRQEYNDLREWPLPENEHGSDVGYLIEDKAGQKNTEQYQGFVQWLPECEFNRKYKQNGLLPFGVAIEALKQGHKACRSGWNGKGMWLSFIPKSHWETTRGLEMLDGLPWIGMKTVDDKFVPWLASQTDVLAEDWLIIE